LHSSLEAATLNTILRSILILSLASPAWATVDIPGTPGVDYTTYTTVPPTSFDFKQQQFPGYFADPEIAQVFHICQADGRHDTYLCPIGTAFDQEYFVCNVWNKVKR
jgi:hypothetical protein